MKITHNDAVILEGIVCSLYEGSHQGSMGGIIEAGHFERMLLLSVFQNYTMECLMIK